MFLLTVPTGNYRCLPAPYERACLIGDYFKKNKIKGKIVLLDPGEKPFAPKAPGFLAAFSELYKDYHRLQAVDDDQIGRPDQEDGHHRVRHHFVRRRRDLSARPRR